MAHSVRAPKQWSLTKHENITSFEAWRQNLQYILSLDENFVPYLDDGCKWDKKTKTNPLRGFADDGQGVQAGKRRSGQQKVTHLELMLGQIANYCPVISRNTIIKNSTSLSSIWQAIRLHYGFQSSGAHFLDFNDIKLEIDERPEDLYQRLVSFIEDNLLQTNDEITHLGQRVESDEEMSPTLENLIVLTWLRLIHPDLPKLVRQRYGTELRSKTLASLKPEISQTLSSLLDEIHSAADSRILRSATKQHLQNSQFSHQYGNNQPLPRRRQTNKSCPLCKQAGRPHFHHYLSTCKFLPPEDRMYLAKIHNTTYCDDENLSDDEDVATTETHQRDTPRHTYRVTTVRSPFLKASYNQHPVKLTLDSGAETNMIKSSTAAYIGAPVSKTTQRAYQADGFTPLNVIGEAHITLTCDSVDIQLDALVIEELDVDILAGMPFMIVNEISIRPAKQQVTIKGSKTVQYDHSDNVLNPSHYSESCNHFESTVDMGPVEPSLTSGHYTKECRKENITSNNTETNVRDLAHLHSDRSKSSAHNRCLVTRKEGELCSVQSQCIDKYNATGLQLHTAIDSENVFANTHMGKSQRSGISSHPSQNHTVNHSAIAVSIYDTSPELFTPACPDVPAELPEIYKQPPSVHLPSLPSVQSQPNEDVTQASSSQQHTCNCKAQKYLRNGVT